MSRSTSAFYAQFVYSLTPIEDVLTLATQGLARELENRGTPVSEDLLKAAWIITRLERELYLHLEVNALRAEVFRVTPSIPPQFLYGNRRAAALLLSQITPTITVRESIPYTERLCRVSIYGSTLQLRFL